MYVWQLRSEVGDDPRDRYDEDRRDRDEDDGRSPNGDRDPHLSPAATEEAIRLLDGRPIEAGSAKSFGDILDTRSAEAERN